MRSEYDELTDDVITVIKFDAAGDEVLRYDGRVLERGLTSVCLRAIFRHETADLGFVRFVRGDVFTEWFYTDRWYNVFRIEDRETRRLKGWYCNLTRPAEISEEIACSVDLALDVFVLPNGECRLLDEDEFAALELSPQDRAAVWAAVEEIQTLAAQRAAPFNPSHRQ